MSAWATFLIRQAAHVVFHPSTPFAASPLNWPGAHLRRHNNISVAQRRHNNISVAQRQQQQRGALGAVAQHVARTDVADSPRGRIGVGRVIEGRSADPAARTAAAAAAAVLRYHRELGKVVQLPVGQHADERAISLRGGGEERVRAARADARGRRLRRGALIRGPSPRHEGPSARHQGMAT